MMIPKIMSVEQKYGNTIATIEVERRRYGLSQAEVLFNSHGEIIDTRWVR